MLVLLGEVGGEIFNIFPLLVKNSRRQYLRYKYYKIRLIFFSHSYSLK